MKTMSVTGLRANIADALDAVEQDRRTTGSC
jgi:hypothetical protein